MHLDENYNAEECVHTRNVPKREQGRAEHDNAEENHGTNPLDDVEDATELECSVKNRARLLPSLYDAITGSALTKTRHIRVKVAASACHGELH